MLFVIALRNLIFEISSAATSTGPALTVTTAAQWLQAIPLRAIFSPAVIVLMSECLVDWLKHAFITKFNHLRPGVYGRFIDVLCKDLVVGGSSATSDTVSGRFRVLKLRKQKHLHLLANVQAYVDQSPYVARRLGFAALPLGCLVVRIISQACEMLVDESVDNETTAGFGKGSSSPHLGSLSQVWLGQLGEWLAMGSIAFFAWTWCVFCPPLLVYVSYTSLRHACDSLVAIKLLIGYEAASSPCLSGYVSDR